MTAAATFWSPDGTRLSELPGFRIESPWLSPWLPTYQFVFSLSEGLTPCRVDSPRSRQILSGRAAAGNFSVEPPFLRSEGRIHLLVPGPVEVRFSVFTGAKKAHTMPARAGEMLEVNGNRLLLVGMYPWRETAIGGGNETLRLCVPDEEDEERSTPENPVTTAVFCGVLREGVTVQAVLHDGSIETGDRRDTGFPWFYCQPEAEMDEIKEFRILEEPIGTEIRCICRNSFSNTSLRIGSGRKSEH
jgi:hypothetical protein